MKFLKKNQRVDRTLSEWSGRDTLLRAKHYFSNLGTPMQKSQLGLMMSLLHQILSKHLSLVATAMPDIRESIIAKIFRHLAIEDEDIRNPGPGQYFLKRDPLISVRSRPDLCIPWSQWSLESLKRSFEKLVNQCDIPAKFCFFIDGLDEYSGDYEEINQCL